MSPDPLKLSQLKALNDLIYALVTLREKLAFGAPPLGPVDIIILRAAAKTASDSAVFLVESGAWRVP